MSTEEDVEAVRAKERKRAKRARDKLRQREKARLSKAKIGRSQECKSAEETSSKGKDDHKFDGGLQTPSEQIKSCHHEAEKRTENGAQHLMNRQTEEEALVYESSSEDEDASENGFRVPQAGRHGSQSVPLTPALPPYAFEDSASLTIPNLAHLSLFSCLSKATTVMSLETDGFALPMPKFSSLQKTVATEHSDSSQAVDDTTPIIPPPKFDAIIEEGCNLEQDQTSLNAVVSHEKGTSTSEDDRHPEQVLPALHSSEEIPGDLEETSKTSSGTVTDSNVGYSSTKEASCEEKQISDYASVQADEQSLSPSETSATSSQKEENASCDCRDDECSFTAEEYKAAMHYVAPILESNIDTVTALYKSGKRLIKVGTYTLEIIDDMGRCQIVMQDYQENKPPCSQDNETVSEDQFDNEEGGCEEEENDDEEQDRNRGSSREGSISSYESALPANQQNLPSESTALHKTTKFDAVYPSNGKQGNRQAFSHHLRDVHPRGDFGRDDGYSSQMCSRDKPSSDAFYGARISPERPSSLSPTLQRAKARLREKGMMSDVYAPLHGTTVHHATCESHSNVNTSSFELGPISFAKEGLEGTLYLYQNHRSMHQTVPNGKNALMGASRSERRRALAAAKSESRWPRPKKRDLIKSKRPQKQGEQGSNGTLTIEEAPLRAYSGSEHRQLPRPKMARNLLSRQYGVRIGHENEWAKRESRLSITSPHLERQLIEHQADLSLQTTQPGNQIQMPHYSHERLLTSLEKGNTNVRSASGAQQLIPAGSVATMHLS